jgi:hypothetical protein
LFGFRAFMCLVVMVVVRTIHKGLLMSAVRWIQLAVSSPRTFEKSVTWLKPQVGSGSDCNAEVASVPH